MQLVECGGDKAGRAECAEEKCGELAEGAGGVWDRVGEYADCWGRESARL